MLAAADERNVNFFSCIVIFKLDYDGVFLLLSASSVDVLFSGFNGGCFRRIVICVNLNLNIGLNFIFKGIYIYKINFDIKK